MFGGRGPSLRIEGGMVDGDQNGGFEGLMGRYAPVFGVCYVCVGAAPGHVPKL